MTSPNPAPIPADTEVLVDALAGTTVGTLAQPAEPGGAITLHGPRPGTFVFFRPGRATATPHTERRATAA
jgi:hypothetical protein